MSQNALVEALLDGDYRLAPRSYISGDPLPEVGSLCFVSGVNCDVESDQHRYYAWRKVIGYSQDDVFVCLQTRDCWPTIARLAECWFGKIPNTRAALAAHARTEEEPITAAAINALPAPLRSYIHQLETRCDPNGEIRELIGLREQKAQLAALVAELEAKPQGITDGGRLAVAQAALERIERWFGEFPSTDAFWPDGSPISYGTQNGSNGERDFMRRVAREALAAMQSTPPATDEEVRE